MIKILLSAAALAGAIFTQYASACTISENILESVPLNYPGIPNSYRIKIVDMVLAARQWPDVEVQAQIIASAYVDERAPLNLAKSRGNQLKDFLIQLGIKPQYIHVDTHVNRTTYPIDSTGHGGYLQLGVSLLPFCKNGCGNLCDATRVSPATKLIK
ncbi:hypothetical protein LGM65_19860 [Burkholderia anthina]|uniref:hypothetical protein n=1 Tax=Burkholderia anthina TaxID=179879 RepID=UPI001CF45582|nr:hypothetical protein [Burkholderia anthina]MCA8093114.1 hypothetical protein [Burkholderia anthina]